MNPNAIATVHAEKPNFSPAGVLGALKYRYATKKFDPNAKIPQETFDALLEAARLAPTSMGFEPWKMIVLTDMEVRQKAVRVGRAEPSRQCQPLHRFYREQAGGRDVRLGVS